MTQAKTTIFNTTFATPITITTPHPIEFRNCRFIGPAPSRATTAHQRIMYKYHDTFKRLADS